MADIITKESGAGCSNQPKEAKPECNYQLIDGAKKG
jgi:hypothetical protein